MKAFWIVVAVLIVAGVALLVSGRDRAPEPTAPAPIVEAAPIARPAPVAKAAPAPSPAPAPTAAKQGAPLAAPIAPGSFETKIEVMNAPSPPAAPSSPAPAPPAPTAQGTSIDAAPPAPPAPQVASQSKQLSPAFDATPPKPMAIEKRDDGSSLLDGRFAISGDGSQEKPYTISWALLVSAQETYKPKQGRTVLPERIKMLDDKYVRITGYIAFPFMAQQATEMLSMQNQWDGCCIGVPPTPYDAIEVTLRRPTVGDERLMQFGVVEGKLKVEPYLRGEWLISLYSMTDAHMSPEM